MADFLVIKFGPRRRPEVIRRVQAEISGPLAEEERRKATLEVIKAFLLSDPLLAPIATLGEEGGLFSWRVQEYSITSLQKLLEEVGENVEGRDILHQVVQDHLSKVLGAEAEETATDDISQGVKIPVLEITQKFHKKG